MLIELDSIARGQFGPKTRWMKLRCEREGCRAGLTIVRKFRSVCLDYAKNKGWLVDEESCRDVWVLCPRHHALFKKDPMKFVESREARKHVRPAYVRKSP